MKRKRLRVVKGQNGKRTVPDSAKGFNKLEGLGSGGRRGRRGKTGRGNSVPREYLLQPSMRKKNRRG